MMDLLIINGRYPDFQAGEIKIADIGIWLLHILGNQGPASLNP